MHTGLQAEASAAPGLVRAQCQTRGTSRIQLVVLTFFAAAVLSACGERTPVNHPAAPPGAAGAGDGESWWVLDAPGFQLVAGEATPDEISASTGSLWMLEYSDSRQSIRLVADRAGGLFSQLSTASPEVDRVMLEGGVEATLRQHPGRPEEGIAPSIGAEWTDDDVFVSFGGPGLTEDALRALLGQVRHVSKAEWEAVAAAAPPRPEEETPPGPPESLVP